MWEFYSLFCASVNHSVQDWNVDTRYIFSFSKDEKINLAGLFKVWYNPGLVRNLNSDMYA